jgi:hypothetical protein
MMYTQIYKASWIKNVSREKAGARFARNKGLMPGHMETSEHTNRLTWV